MFVALSLARLLGAPVAVVVVAGYSMYPTLKPGDIVVVEKIASPAEIRPGVIVVWCTGPHSCVIHRVVEVIDEKAVVTKGDANPAPDPPVPISSVEYRAVYVIPRITYLAPLAVAVAYDLARAARRLAAGAAGLEAYQRLVVLGFTLYLAALMLTPLVAPRPATPFGNLEALRPRVSLVNASLEGGVVTAYLHAEKTSLVSVEACTARASTASTGCVASLEPLGNGFYRLRAAPVPAARFYDEAYRAGATRLEVDAAIRLSLGRLYACVPVLLHWEPPRARFYTGNCTLVITNPNPAPLRVNITVMRANLSTGPGYAVKPLSALRLQASLPPQGRVAERLGGAQLVSVDIRYPLPGGRGAGRIHVGGWCVR